MVKLFYTFWIKFITTFLMYKKILKTHKTERKTSVQKFERLIFLHP